MQINVNCYSLSKGQSHILNLSRHIYHEIISFLDIYSKEFSHWSLPKGSKISHMSIADMYDDIHFIVIGKGNGKR